MPHSDLLPRIVLPDNDRGHSEVTRYCNSKGQVPGGVGWCGDFVAYYGKDERRCDRRDPRLMLDDAGTWHNWRHRCPARFMLENLDGAPEDAYRT